MFMQIVVAGVPVPKARARTVVRGGRAHSYTPEGTKTWEETVSWIAAAHRPPSPLQGPLAVALRFYLPRPRTVKREYPRGDTDNYAKSILDACNGILWEDDAQIIRLVASKEFGDPRVEIDVSPMMQIGDGAELQQNLTQDEFWILEQYRRARACRYAALEIRIQDCWPVSANVTAKEQGPRKEVV